MPTSDESPSPSLSTRGLLIAALAFVALLVAPSIASALPAPSLFATTGGTGESSKTAPPSNLWKLDPATGAPTALGNTGYAITGLAQDPTTGVLYAVSNAKSPVSPLTLLTVDPATGAAAQVGPLGKERKVADISFNSLGQLYGWWDEPEDVFVSIDKANGTVTPIGTPGVLSTYGSGLSFDLNDTLWFFGLGEFEAFHTIDPATGGVTERGKLTPINGNESPVSAAAWDCARTTLYALVQNEGKPPANLVTINTATGVITDKGLTVTAADGLEWYCPQAFEFGGNPSIKVAPGKTFALPVVRGPRIKGSANVAFTTANGTAKAGQDFVTTSGTVAFGNNVNTGSVSVTTKANQKAGSPRTFQVVLSNPSGGGTVGTPVSVTITTLKPARAKVSGPKSTHKASPVFKLRSKQLPARFRCKLDKGKFKGCGKAGKKPKKFKTPELDPGQHTLVVQIVNGAGQKSKPAKKKFTILP